MNKFNSIRFVSVLLIGGVILGSVFLLSPWKQNLNSLNTDLLAKEQLLVTLESKLDEVNKLMAVLPSSETAKNSLLKAVPLELKQSNLLSDLNTVASDNGVVFSGVSFSLRENVQDGVGIIGVSASFSGTYDDLISFLQDLENSKRKIAVNTINVQIEEGEEGAPARAEFSLVLEAYYQGAAK